MAEGLDQAADAFRAEIGGKPAPRDDQGRFTAARPAPLFPDRQLEGDPPSGGARDGGESPLAEHERRVADGRAERDSPPPEGERDEAEAAGKPPEPKEPEEAKPEDEGEDGPDYAVTLDGQPVEKFEVSVGGETRQVTLSEALKGYADSETVNRQGADVREAALYLQGEAGKINEVRQSYAQRLEYADRLLKRITPPEPNWDQEFAQNPGAAREKQKVFGLIRDEMGQIAQEMQREAAQQHEETQRREAEYANWGISEFRRRRNLSDNASYANEIQQMRKAAFHYGFTEQEIARVFDPRMLEVLLDNSKYLRATAEKIRPVMPDKGRTLAPGAARPIGSAVRKGIDDALKTQARSGSLDDTARVFERIIR